jgi:murein DD-endopeptidase MepM/ murein hydrolase activator NlpD
MKPGAKLLLAVIIVLLMVVVYLYLRMPGSPGRANRTGRVLTWLADPEAYPEWGMQAGERCLDAPFMFPTDGYVGYLWGDSFRPGHKHQGIDIFGGGEVGDTPIIAAYSGYLTRLPEWKSTIIIRIPEDPLEPGRQIWTYYTHMADKGGNSLIENDFPPGTYDVFVEQGTLLGYQGNYSGTPGNPTGVHLHFSIVMDDGDGMFLNELKIANTIDPSQYFQMNLNGETNAGEVPSCQ